MASSTSRRRSAIPPAIAVVDADTNEVLDRIFFAVNSRPHHVHASVGGRPRRRGALRHRQGRGRRHERRHAGRPWDSNPTTTTGRIHAAVFSPDGNTLYLANEGSGLVTAMDPLTGSVLWDMTVPGVHELAVTRTAGSSSPAGRCNQLAVIDLASHTWTDVLPLGLPDTLRLSANERLLTVGLRTSPAQLVVVDTETFAHEIVDLAEPGQLTTMAGHQWTSPERALHVRGVRRRHEPRRRCHRSSNRSSGDSEAGCTPADRTASITRADSSPPFFRCGRAGTGVPRGHGR